MATTDDGMNYTLNFDATRIDVRLTASNMEALKSLIGKRMTKYKRDPFESSATSVYGIVGIEFEDATAYAFTNTIAVMDYFGDQDDVALFKMEPVPILDSIQSRVQGGKPG